MNVIIAIIVGVIVGLLIGLAIDWIYWGNKIKSNEKTVASLEEQKADLERQLGTQRAAIQPVPESGKEAVIIAEQLSEQDESQDVVPIESEWGAEPVVSAVVLEEIELDRLEGIEKYHENIEYIEGIGPVYGGKLREIGITNPLDLLQWGSSDKGRAEIAERTGISHTLILGWVNHVDLYRVKGIGSEYGDLLERAGVDTVVELSMRNPENLYNKLVEVNQEKNLVRQLPGADQVAGWVAQAKDLPRIVTY